MNDTILGPPSKALDAFIELCAEVGVEDADTLRAAAQERVAELHHEAVGQSACAQLEREWYHTYSWSVYEDDRYLAELWACWATYSRGYLMAFRKVLESGRLPTPETVVDLGCGVGLTTAFLADLLPEAVVVGTNLPDTKQTRIAELLGVEIVDAARPCDLVFASEYFEHFEEPVAHLRDVVGELDPKHMIIANAFGADATGHFDYYNIGDAVVPGSQAGRYFNREMRALGYKVLFSGWNGRPAYWGKA